MARGRKYEIDKLEIGEEIVLPWRGATPEERTKNGRRATNAICQEQRRFSKKFQTYGHVLGLIVKRLK